MAEAEQEGRALDVGALYGVTRRQRFRSLDSLRAAYPDLVAVLAGGPEEVSRERNERGARQARGEGES